MLSPGLAKKITIHLNEDTSSQHDFLYREIFSFLHERGVAGATMLRQQPDSDRITGLIRRNEGGRSGSICRYGLSSLRRRRRSPGCCRRCAS